MLMTTMAALLGAVPMMVGTGVGSEIRQPLGYAIVGGLALSQILTLYTTPVVYIYLDRLQNWQGQETGGLRPGCGSACRMIANIPDAVTAFGYPASGSSSDRRSHVRMDRSKL
ncbi:MAG: acriflavine resistance protein [Bradyrhizobium sp.]|jgi:hypothetical protein|nr:acriflavine resistance protein [Bradyrhizobium sp.]